MEILNYLMINYTEFNAIPIQTQIPKEIHINERIHLELERLRLYLTQFRFQDFLNGERFCIYENYDRTEEDGIFIEINYLTSHNAGYLTDHYNDQENEFFNEIPAIAEEMESVFGRTVLYTYPDREHIEYYDDGTLVLDNDSYQPSKDEEIYLVQEAVKILCEYPAFQVLECPYGHINVEDI